MGQQNNSGEAGMVTLFRRGSRSTLVVLNIASVPAGRSQPAHINGGHFCDGLDPKPAFRLARVERGVSRTLVTVSEAFLLCGNYVVNIHSLAQNLGRYVSCGEPH